MYSVVNILFKIVHKVFTIVTCTALKTKVGLVLYRRLGFCITSNKTCHGFTLLFTGPLCLFFKLVQVNRCFQRLRVRNPNVFHSHTWKQSASPRSDSSAGSDFVDVLSASVGLRNDGRLPTDRPSLQTSGGTEHVTVIFYLHKKAGRCSKQSITKKEASAEFFGEFSLILPVWSGSKLLPISLVGKLFLPL